MSASSSTESKFSLKGHFEIEPYYLGDEDKEHIRGLHAQYQGHAKTSAVLALTGTLFVALAVIIALCGSICFTLSGVNVMSHILLPAYLPAGLLFISGAILLYFNYKNSQEMGRERQEVVGHMVPHIKEIFERAETSVASQREALPELSLGSEQRESFQNLLKILPTQQQKPLREKLHKNFTESLTAEKKEQIEEAEEKAKIKFIAKFISGEINPKLQNDYCTTLIKELKDSLPPESERSKEEILLSKALDAASKRILKINA